MINRKIEKIKIQVKKLKNEKLMTKLKLPFASDTSFKLFNHKLFKYEILFITSSFHYHLIFILLLIGLG